MSRLSTITAKITRSPTKNVWSGILIVLLLIFSGLGALTLVDPKPVETAETNDFLTYLPNFEYQQGNGVSYPTCNFNNNNKNSQLKSLADYTFLASLAYAEDDTTQRQLDQWFNTTVKFDVTIVDEFKKNVGHDVNSPVDYRLITFPGKNNSEEAIVSIRGSVDPIDFLTDTQLWMSSALFQFLRFFLPMGGLWTPLMHHLVRFVNYLESESIEKISFYKETTKFVKWLKESGKYSNIQLTGHSLGGGLAIISGAQSNVSGIGISAPNSKLSRDAFTPPITIESLNANTFNVIPDKDIVPKIDDVAQNFQKVRCTANSGYVSLDAVDCHGTGTRTLCELLYTCGTTSNRPALCECVYDFGYPKPHPKAGYENLNFDEQCASLNDKWKKKEDVN